MEFGCTIGIDSEIMDTVWIHFSPVSIGRRLFSKLIKVQEAVG